MLSKYIASVQVDDIAMYKSTWQYVLKAAE
jgi:hypothetical protein